MGLVVGGGGVVQTGLCRVKSVKIDKARKKSLFTEKRLAVGLPQVRVGRGDGALERGQFYTEGVHILIGD